MKNGLKLLENRDLNVTSSNPAHHCDKPSDQKLVNETITDAHLNATRINCAVNTF